MFATTGTIVVIHMQKKRRRVRNRGVENQRPQVTKIGERFDQRDGIHRPIETQRSGVREQPQVTHGQVEERQRARYDAVAVGGGVVGRGEFRHFGAHEVYTQADEYARHERQRSDTLENVPVLLLQ